MSEKSFTLQTEHSESSSKERGQIFPIQTDQANKVLKILINYMASFLGDKKITKSLCAHICEKLVLYGRLLD